MGEAMVAVLMIPPMMSIMLCFAAALRWPRGPARVRTHGSVLFGEYLGLRFSVRIEVRLVSSGPGSALLRALDVPIGTATPKHCAQVESKLFHRGPAEEPISIVDLVNTQARLEHQGVRDHRIMVRIGVFRDV